MLDTQSTNYSQQYLQEQIDFLMETRPYIREVHTTASSNLNADYFQAKDATASGITKDYRIQFKNRLEGHNDFVVKALKQSGSDALDLCNGFFFNGNKYSFNLLSDIYVERMGDGHILSISREELEAIQNKHPDLLSACISAVVQSKKKDSNGNYFTIPEYDVYITPQGLANIQLQLLLDQNYLVADFWREHFEN